MKTPNFKRMIQKMMVLPKSVSGGIMDYISSAVVGVVIVAVTLVIGFVMLAALQTTLTTNSYAYNATVSIQASLYNNGVTVFGIIILVVFFVAVLFVLKSLNVGGGGDGGRY